MKQDLDDLDLDGVDLHGVNLACCFHGCKWPSLCLVPKRSLIEHISYTLTFINVTCSAELCLEVIG